MRCAVEIKPLGSSTWVEMPGCNNLRFSTARWRLTVGLAMDATALSDKEVIRALQGASRRVAKWRDLSQSSEIHIEGHHSYRLVEDSYHKRPTADISDDLATQE